MIFERTPEIELFPNIGNDIEVARYYRQNLNNALDDGIKEFFETAKNVKINGDEYCAHKNVNLYIDVTTKCPFNCGFCIAKTVDGRNGEIKPEQVKSAIDYLENLGINYTIQVTGGEPEIHKDYYDIIELLPKERKLVLNTNMPSEKSLNVFDNVNVSCHHYNSEIEKQITVGERNLILKNNINKVRMNTNLIGGYIDTFGEIMQMIAFAYYKYGVTNICFSFLTDLPSNTMYKKEIIDYTHKRPAASFDSILGAVESAGHWEFEKFRGGVACYYEIWKYTAYKNDVLVQFKYSDNSYLDYIDGLERYIPDLILHPNGVLTGSWDLRKKIIHDF